MSDATEDAKSRALVQELLARGVPWLLAVEAVASTALDRDHTQHVPSEPTDAP